MIGSNSSTKTGLNSSRDGKHSSALSQNTRIRNNVAAVKQTLDDKNGANAKIT